MDCSSEKKLQKLNKGKPPGSFKLEAKLAADLKKQLRTRQKAERTATVLIFGGEGLVS